MPQIHVLGIDHDSSAGSAIHYSPSCKIASRVYPFLLSLISPETNLIYVANDSLRQDQHLDLLNLILNAHIPDPSDESSTDVNGSVFQTLELLTGELKARTGKTVNICKLLTPDLFPKSWQNTSTETFYYGTIKQQGFNHCQQIKSLPNTFLLSLQGKTTKPIPAIP